MINAKSMSFSTTKEMANAIDSICNEKGWTRSWFISTAIKNYITECLEDKSDYNDAVSAWKKFENSSKKTYTSEELRKEFGL